MKKAIHFIVLFHCLVCLPYLNCLGNVHYAVQIAASKTPTDVKWFSSKHQIDQEILEIEENGWYKYVIGEFVNLQAASKYIDLNLQSKGLQGPFPRILPDSLKKFPQNEIKSKISDLQDINEAIPALKADTASATNSGTIQKSHLESKEKQDQDQQILSDKYSRWEKMMSWERSQNIEMKLIQVAKLFLPRSFLPFYIQMIDSAIRFPIILFFLMLIILFILNALVIMIILEASNTLKNQLLRYSELYQTMYERVVTGYLFQEFDIETAIHRLKKMNRPRNRKIFVSVLFNFQKNLSGDSDEKILEIFFRLGLNEDAVKKINSHSLYFKILGLRELTNFHPSGAFSIVESHINDKNDTLRAEAQSSYVRLNREEPFRFINKLRKPFTRWTQLTSFYIFKLHKLPAPSFAEFLQSDLYNVQNFSLRMITYFQQQENAGEIIKLLGAVRDLTRYLAIRAIVDLGIREAKPLLKERFEDEIYRNKLEIVKAMQHIGNTDDFNFLEKIIRGNDVTLKIEACRSMYFMNSSGIENLLLLNQEQELCLEPFIAHINDPRN